jgi:hypothetical protein
VKHHYQRTSLDLFVQVPTTTDAVPNPLDDVYEPHVERAHSVRLLSLKKPFGNDHDHDLTSPDANDDEVHQLIDGKQNQSNTFVSTSTSKPGLLRDAQTTALNQKLDLGLLGRDAFSDPHDGQQQQGDAVSTQNGFHRAQILHPSHANSQASSFRPTDRRVEVNPCE